MIENDPLIKYSHTIIISCIIAWTGLFLYLQEYLYEDYNE